MTGIAATILGVFIALWPYRPALRIAAMVCVSAALGGLSVGLRSRDAFCEVANCPSGPLAIARASIGEFIMIALAFLVTVGVRRIARK